MKVFKLGCASVLGLVCLTACGESGGELDDVRLVTSAIGQEFYYLRCNATGWGVDAATRMVAEPGAGTLSLQYEVTEPWMVASGDNCQLTRTNQENGWGTEQAFLGDPAGGVIQVPGGSEVEAGGGLVVRYPETGAFTATYDLETGVLSFAESDAASSKLPVVAYYLRPSDLPHREEYFDAMVQAMTATADWYAEHAGVTFEPEFRTAVGPDHQTMRCGSNPDPSCANDVSQLTRWWFEVQSAVGGLPQEQVTVIFSQGGGGFAGANLTGRFRGITVVGDWVLGPISGINEPGTHNCEVAGNPIYCQFDVAFGTVAHEIGHAFGLHHPPAGSPPTIMSDHTTWPNTQFLPHEMKILELNPMLVAEAYDSAAPFLAFENADVLTTGSTVTLSGSNLQGVDRVDFVDGVQTVSVTPSSVASGAVTVTVPSDIGIGFARAFAGTSGGNALPVNFE